MTHPVPAVTTNVSFIIVFSGIGIMPGTVVDNKYLFNEKMNTSFSDTKGNEISPGP